MYENSYYWKYVFVKTSLDEDYIFDETISLGVCGDYFNGNNIESAYFSACNLSKRIKA